MKLQATHEDYLKAILILEMKNACVRNIDLAKYFSYSRASISNAISLLAQGGYVCISKEKRITLTDSGRKIAEMILERREFFVKVLVLAGVDEHLAQKEACKLEHSLSQESFEKLKVMFPLYSVQNKDKA